MEMSAISKKLGTIVLMGVPAIIGGGIVYFAFGNYTAVIVYEVILGFASLGFISK
jgi:alpha-D-ribose 1-methylphosphonate 5-triphosphate diphosphatase PhnM